VSGVGAWQADLVSPQLLTEEIYRLLLLSLATVMYSLVFGQAGPDRVIEILAAEMAQNLRLLGATKLSELTPAMVNARALEADLYEPYISPIPNLRVGTTQEKL